MTPPQFAWSEKAVNVREGTSPVSPIETVDTRTEFDHLLHSVDLAVNVVFSQKNLIKMYQGFHAGNSTVLLHTLDPHNSPKFGKHKFSSLLKPSQEFVRAHGELGVITLRDRLNSYIKPVKVRFVATKTPNGIRWNIWATIQHILPVQK